MIEQDAIAAVHAVSLAVIHGQLKAGALADAIGTAGMERSALALRRLAYLAEHFARAGKIELALGLQFAQRSQDVVRAVDVGGHGGKAVGEALRHEALGRQMITFVELFAA